MKVDPLDTPVDMYELKFFLVLAPREPSSFNALVIVWVSMGAGSSVID